MSKDYFTHRDIKTYKINYSDFTKMEILFKWEKNYAPRNHPVANGYITMNKHLYPHEQFYYFTTMKDSTLNNDILILNHNNIAFPLSRDVDNEKTEILASVLGNIESEYASRKTLDEGIWVVEQIFIPRERRDVAGKALAYANYNRYIGGDDDSYRRSIYYNAKTVAATLKPIDIINECSYYTIYFIPRKLIVSYENIYVPKFNIFITRTNNLTDIKHPDLRDDDIDTSLIDKPELTTHTNIKYEIVKYGAVNACEKYYVKTGNSVMPINPIFNADKPEGCYKTVLVNGIAMDKQFCKLEDMAKEFGIYRSEDEALYNGDLSKQIELNKLSVDKNKIELEVKKLQSESERINVENERLKLEYRKLEVDHEKISNEKEKLILEKDKLVQESEKIKLENIKLANEAERLKNDSEKIKLEFDKTKLEGEKLKVEKEKMEHELKKLEFENRALELKVKALQNEYRKKVLEHSLTISKLETELGYHSKKLDMDYQYSKLKQEMEMRSLKLKSVNDVTSKVCGLISGGMALATLLASK